MGVKIIIFLVGIVFSIPASPNYLINPGFDEIPWNTGWIIQTQGLAYAGSADTYVSPPNSARLVAMLDKKVKQRFVATVEMYQEVPNVIAAICSVWYKYEIQTTDLEPPITPEGWVRISVKVNGDWAKEWGDSASYAGSHVWRAWSKTYGISDTVSGIKFTCGIWGEAPPVNYGQSTFWLDNACIGDTPVGVEESNLTDRKSEILNILFNIVPNPFGKKTVIRYTVPQGCGVAGNPEVAQHNGNISSLTIYNVAGRLVRTFPLRGEGFNLSSARLSSPKSTDGRGEPLLNSRYSLLNSVIWDGSDDNGNRLPSGIYLCKLRFIGGDESLIKQLLLLR